MASICIKFIGKDKIEYVIQILELLKMDICISYYQFRIYDNLIIHYSSKNIKKEEMDMVITEILVKVIEKYFEGNIVKKIIRKNYFYLSNLEQRYIYDITKKVLELPDEKIGEKRKNLKNSLLKYISENTRLFIDGFVNFRTKDYKEIIDKVVEISVFSYLDLNSF